VHMLCPHPQFFTRHAGISRSTRMYYNPILDPHQYPLPIWIRGAGLAGVIYHTPRSTVTRIWSYLVAITLFVCQVLLQLPILYGVSSVSVSLFPNSDNMIEILAHCYPDVT